MHILKYMLIHFINTYLTFTRMVVHIYQKFSISACGTDFLRLSDGENSASKCGVVTTYQQIFFTQSNRLDVWYSSNSNKDQVAVSVTGRPIHNFSANSWFEILLAEVVNHQPLFGLRIKINVLKAFLYIWKKYWKPMMCLHYIPNNLLNLF